MQTIQQNPQIVQIQPQQNQQNQPVQMQQVTVQQSQAQPQQRKGLTLSVNKIFFVMTIISHNNIHVRLIYFLFYFATTE